VKTTSADVVVIGIGTMGSTTLWRLARAGVRAIGIEQFTPGHDQGSGHGESRILRTAYHEGASYVPLVRSAVAYWRELEADSGKTLLQLTGALMIGSPESAVVHGALQAAHTHRLPHEVLEADALRLRFPQHAVGDRDVAVYEKEAGILLPEQSILAATEAATRHGAEIITNTRVLGIRAGSRDTIEVETQDQLIHAGHVVVTSGAWTPALLPQLSPQLTVQRKVLAWFPARHPADYSPDRFPVFIRENPNAHWFGFPTLDRQTVKLALHHGGEHTTAEELDRTVRSTDIEPLAELVRAYLPQLDSRPTRSVVCMYTNTPDGHFLVGHLPDMAQVTVLAGFSGHGFKFASVLGEAAAQLAIHGETHLPIDTFSPQRFASTRGERGCTVRSHLPSQCLCTIASAIPGSSV